VLCMCRGEGRVWLWVVGGVGGFGSVEGGGEGTCGHAGSCFHVFPATIKLTREHA
jgi:hypothetical protein